MEFDLDFFVKALVALFVLIDPPGVVVIFSSLTQGQSFARRWAMALKGTLVAAGILVLFAVFGQAILSGIGITMPAFRTAGGILLFMIGLEMVFERRAKRRSKSAEAIAEEGDTDPTHEEHEDISIFPLAIPLIAGPGAIASIVLLMGSADGAIDVASVFGALGVVLVVTFLFLVFASQLLSLMGESVSLVLARLMGILLCALSVQFVFDGVRAGVLGEIIAAQ